MEQYTTIISSRGLLKSCCAHNLRPASSLGLIDAELLGRHRAHGSIYVCSDALPEFAARCLPQLHTPFTLVSGDSDLPIGPASLGQVFETIVQNPLCIAWFAQNAQAQHPKLRLLPIGLDYHTMFERPGVWGGISPMSPMAQERQLLDTWSRSPEPTQRYLAAYCNWTHALERGDRRECLARIDPKSCFIERQHVPRASSWARQAEFLFVVSPEGAGMDCHRTWEALLLGCIPIVKRNALAPLLRTLPVLIVEDWAEVRRDRLERHLTEVVEKKFDFAILYRDTWVRRISGWADHPEQAMTYAEFRKLLLRSSN